MTTNETQLSPYIAYTTHFFDENPGKPVLVLLHGFLGNSKDWHAIIDRFKTNFRILSFDLPGHGASLMPTHIPLDFMNMVQSIQGIITQYTQTYVLLGYSFGGRVAFGLQAYYPNSVTHLIIESSTPGIQKQSERDRRIVFDTLLAKQLKTIPFNDFLEKWFNFVVFHSQKRHPNFPALRESRLRNNSPEHLSRALSELGTGKQENYWPYVSKISCPMLFITGEYDTKFKLIGERLTALIANYTFIVIPDISHNVHFEAESQFILALDKWFKTHL